MRGVPYLYNKSIDSSFEIEYILTQTCSSVYFEYSFPLHVLVQFLTGYGNSRSKQNGLRLVHSPECSQCGDVDETVELIVPQV